jgi:hypothetical protein
LRENEQAPGRSKKRFAARLLLDLGRPVRELRGGHGDQVFSTPGVPASATSMETSPTSRLPAAAVSGAWALTVLPIDAGPDVTNVQVNVLAKHLS